MSRALPLRAACGALLSISGLGVETVAGARRFAGTCLSVTLCGGRLFDTPYPQGRRALVPDLLLICPPSRSLDWRREKAIVMETPVSGEILRWRGRAKDVDVMLQNISYSSDLPG